MGCENLSQHIIANLPPDKIIIPNTNIFKRYNHIKFIPTSHPHQNNIPFWERYTLTIEEALDYFRIGRTRLRQLIHENPDADYILMIGNRTLIKRKMFEKYVDSASVI